MKKVTIFASSTMEYVPSFKFEIENFLETLNTKLDFSVKYGGGQVGLMGSIAQICRELNIRSEGFVPKALAGVELKSELPNDVEIVNSFADRKEKLFDSDAVCVFPGGFGTLDELFECLVLKQLGIMDVPIIVVNVDDYYGKLIRQFEVGVELGSVVLEGRDTFREVKTGSEASELLSEVLSRTS